MINETQSAADRAMELFGLLVGKKRWDDLDKALDTWAEINAKVDRQIPPVAGIAELTSGYSSLFRKREALMQYMYLQQLLPYECLVRNLSSDN